MLHVLSVALCQPTTKYHVPVDGAPRVLASTEQTIVPLLLYMLNENRSTELLRKRLYSRTVPLLLLVIMSLLVAGLLSKLTHAATVKSISPVDKESLSITSKKSLSVDSKSAALPFFPAADPTPPVPFSVK